MTPDDVTVAYTRERILESLRAGALTFRGLSGLLYDLEPGDVRAGLTSLQATGHVHSMQLQRPRRARHRDAKRPMRIYALAPTTPWRP